MQQVLASEGAHLRRWMRERGADALAKELASEVLQALPAHVVSAPERLGEHEYYVVQGADHPHPRYLRRRPGGQGAAAEEVVLDVNELARVHGDDIFVGQVRIPGLSRPCLELQAPRAPPPPPPPQPPPQRSVFPATPPGSGPNALPFLPAQIKLSRDGGSVAFTVAAPGGDEVYSSFVRDVASGRIAEQPAMRGVVSLEWGADGATLG